METRKVIVKVLGYGQIKATGGTGLTALRSAGYDPKAWDIALVKETKHARHYTATPKESIEAKPIGPNFCENCNGYYTGESCPKCVVDVQTREEARDEESEHLIMTDALTGAILTAPVEEPFEPLHLTLYPNELVPALKIATDITDKRSIMPILSHIHLVANGTTCILVATDLQVSWIKRLQCKGDAVGRCIPAKLLLKEIKALPDGAAVELIFTRDAVSVNGRCEILTADDAEFPEVQTEPELADAEAVSNMVDGLKRVSPAISTDETRYVLTSALVDTENGKVVGTDGFRMHLSDIPKGSGIHILIPRNTVMLITKHGAADSVKLLDEKHAGFSVGGGVLTTRLMEGNFPDYANVIPKSVRTITFNRADFGKLLEGALAMEEKVVLRFKDDRLTLQTDAGGVGTYDWQIPADLKGQDGEIRTVFNGRFLLDALNAYPADQVTLQTPDGYGACLFNEKAIVMPIRE